MTRNYMSPLFYPFLWKTDSAESFALRLQYLKHATMLDSRQINSK